MPSTLRVMRADITTLKVDAIVNAARVAVAAVSSLLPELGFLREVIFCCFSASDFAVYRKLLDDSCDKTT